MHTAQTLEFVLKSCFRCPRLNIPLMCFFYTVNTPAWSYFSFKILLRTNSTHPTLLLSTPTHKNKPIFILLIKDSKTLRTHSLHHASPRILLICLSLKLHTRDSPISVCGFIRQNAFSAHTGGSASVWTGPASRTCRELSSKPESSSHPYPLPGLSLSRFCFLVPLLSNLLELIPPSLTSKDEDIFSVRKSNS